MARKRRAVNPEAVEALAIPAIRALFGEGAHAWRYTVLVPLEEIKAGKRPRRIASEADITNLGLTFARHFGGYTTGATVPSLVGWGARDPDRPTETLEANRHAYFIIYVAAVRASDDYFLALQRELQAALGEGVILVERQDVTIL